jgi:hypothetical protein
MERGGKGGVVSRLTLEEDDDWTCEATNEELTEPECKPSTKNNATGDVKPVTVAERRE